MNDIETYKYIVLVLLILNLGIGIRQWVKYHKKKITKKENTYPVNIISSETDMLINSLVMAISELDEIEITPTQEKEIRQRLDKLRTVESG